MELKQDLTNLILCTARKTKFRFTSLSSGSRTTTSLSTTRVEILNDKEDPNIAFLSSNLNNMLVCGVLKGINLSLLQFEFDEANLFNAKEI